MVISIDPDFNVARSASNLKEAVVNLFTNSPVDVLAIGRSGVDIYPLEIGVGLEQVEQFGKFLGGSPTNVAVASARLRHSSAVITGVGDDPFGRYVCSQMRALGLFDFFVVKNSNFTTPVTFCEIFPPDNFPLYFYREPSAPDLELTREDIPVSAVQESAIFWLTVTGLSKEPSRSAHHYALQHRQSRSGNWTIMDLDYRPVFWETPEQARIETEKVLSQVDIAVGNQDECRMAVGESDPDRAADALLDRGAKIAIVKQGPKGTLCKTRQERIEVPVTPVKVINGLGAGDAFGGTLCHGLLTGWELPQVILAASTAGAIVASRLECSTAMPTEPEILSTIAQNPQVKPIITPVVQGRK